MNKSELKQLVRDEVLVSSYELMFESTNPTNHYDFEHSRKNLWEFNDRKDIKHFIILNQSIYKGDTIAEVKFGWVDGTGKQRYDKPPTYDSRIFDTYLYIFLNEILKYYSEYYTEFYLEANDALRHRLYRQTLNTLLDKTKYTMGELEGKNTLIIKSK